MSSIFLHQNGSSNDQVINVFNMDGCWVRFRVYSWVTNQMDVFKSSYLQVKALGTPMVNLQPLESTRVNSAESPCLSPASLHRTWWGSSAQVGQDGVPIYCRYRVLKLAIQGWKTWNKALYLNSSWYRVTLVDVGSQTCQTVSVGESFRPNFGALRQE